MEFSLLGAAAVAMGAAFAALWWEGRRDGGARERFDLLVSAALIGLLVGRLASMIGGGTNPLAHPMDILIVRGGVNTGFAAAAAVAAALLLSRDDLPARLDALAVPALAGLAGWHAACVLRGACGGTATTLPWGITEAGGAVARHPVEAYAALLLAAGAAAILWWRKRGSPPAGAAGGAALAWAAGARLATEPMRLGIGGGPEWWYAAGAAAGLGIITWAVVASRRVGGQP